MRAYLDPVVYIYKQRNFFHGFTECVIDIRLYRAHPCYLNETTWNYWAFFKWDDYEFPIFGKIEIFLYISQYEFNEEY